MKTEQGNLEPKEPRDMDSVTYFEDLYDFIKENKIEMQGKDGKNYNTDEVIHRIMEARLGKSVETIKMFDGRLVDKVRGLIKEDLEDMNGMIRHE